LDFLVELCDLCAATWATVTWAGHQLDVYTVINAKFINNEKLIISRLIELTIDFVLSGRLAIGGAISSSCPELRAE
jgi:hypothetical protein